MWIKVGNIILACDKPGRTIADKEIRRDSNTHRRRHSAQQRIIFVDGGDCVKTAGLKKKRQGRLCGPALIRIRRDKGGWGLMSPPEKC